MDLESPIDHVDARANLLGSGFSPLTIRYVLMSWSCYSQLVSLWSILRLDGISYDLLCGSKACFHHDDLSYTSTAIPITRYTISRPIFITGIYYTPWRPPTQLMILTFLTLRLFYAFTAFRLHDFTANSLFLTLRLLYVFPTFRLHDFTAITTTFDLIHPASPFPILFPYTLLRASTLGTLQGSDQLLVVSATSPEDQRQIQPDIRESTTTDSTRFQGINERQII
jgi:hypothetical protein